MVHLRKIKISGVDELLLWNENLHVLDRTIRNSHHGDFTVPGNYSHEAFRDKKQREI